MKQSDYTRRFDAAVTELNAAGVSGWNGIPPYLRISRKMGFEPRPPLYESFAKVAFSQGIFFAVVWGILMNLFIWRDQGMLPVIQVFGAALTGLFFGISMAVWSRYVRRKSGLSSWDDL